MSDTLIFAGRNEIRYGYGRYGYTRGGGKTWHGGADIAGLDSKTVRMPYYHDGSGAHALTGKVTRARIVTNHNNKTWEWGHYVCVQITDGAGGKAKFLYFCHNASLIVKVGDVVRSGDALAVMGNTGNAALADPPYDHLHFEVRETATGKGIDPTPYMGFENAVGIYGTESESQQEETALETIIDVSKYQGAITWSKVPYRAILRVGYRGYGAAGTLAADSCFEANITGAKNAGKLFGFYFFSQAKTEAEARAEAEYADGLIAGRGAGLPLFIDCEWSSAANHTGRADGISKSQRTACARAFCKRAAELGYLAGVYTFTSFAGTSLDYEGLCKDYVGWLADTRTNYNTTLPRHLHQYGQGNVAGISGSVDLNHLVKALPSAAEESAAPSSAVKTQLLTIGPVTNGDAMQIYKLCKELKLTDAGLYKAEYV